MVWNNVNWMESIISVYVAKRDENVRSKLLFATSVCVLYTHIRVKILFHLALFFVGVFPLLYHARMLHRRTSVALTRLSWQSFFSLSLVATFVGTLLLFHLSDFRSSIFWRYNDNVKALFFKWFWMIERNVRPLYIFTDFHLIFFSSYTQTHKHTSYNEGTVC